MVAWFMLLLRLAVSTLQRRRDLLLENLALRHQLLVLHPTAKPPAPRIHGELLKLNFALAQRTVAKHMVPRACRPSSQTWTTFLRNHLGQVVSVDFFTVPTANFRLLYVFLVLSHQRRQVLHFNVVEEPSAAWAAQQLREAFPCASPPKYLLRDRDGVYGR